MTALWTVEAMATAMGAEREGVLPYSVSGISAYFSKMGEMVLHGPHQSAQKSIKTGRPLLICMAVSVDRSPAACRHLRLGEIYQLNR